jgi:LemA protein
MSTVAMIQAGAALLVGVAILAMYNRLVALARRCDQAFADIDVQMKQRHDLVPNLVETVRGVAGHERGTLEAVIKARAAAVNAPNAAAQLKAEDQLSGALSRLMMVTEAYPQLQATANFSALQDELSDLENKIAAARRYLNNAVTEYNTSLEQAPANLVGWMFGMKGKAMFDLGVEKRQQLDLAPAVKF